MKLLEDCSYDESDTNEEEINFTKTKFKIYRLSSSLLDHTSSKANGKNSCSHGIICDRLDLGENLAYTVAL